MTLSTLLLLALVLACPISMFFMHRGGHDHGSRASSGSDAEREKRLDVDAKNER